MKVLISDYDQTLFTSIQGIEENKINIEKFRNKGNLFVIATGRSFDDFMWVVNKHDLKYDYVIINHGATILDSNNKIILSNTYINNNILSDLKEDLSLEESLDYFCCSGLDSRLDFNHKDLTKINIKYKDTTTRESIFKKVKDKYSNYINIYPISDAKIEIVSKDSSKYIAAKSLIDKLNINKDNIYVIGDSYSDIEIVKNFNGYCMKNSVDELKKVATKEYNSVSELLKYIN